MFYLLAALSASYWYCLPVIKQRVIGYSEFRLYDVLMALLIVVLATRYRLGLKSFFRKDQAGKWLFRLCLWASATYPITAVWSLSGGNMAWVLVTGIYLFHLWGFVLAYAGFRMFVRTSAQCFRLLDLFLLLGAVEAVIICLQGIGALPTFWSELYGVYGGKAYSGTLGPNRVCPGVTMVLLLAVAASYWRNPSAVGPVRLALALNSAGIGLLALGITGSRTAWVLFATFCLLLLVLARRRVAGTLALGLVVVILLAVAGPSSIKHRFVEMYHWKVSAKLEHAAADSLTGQVQAVDAGRLNIWIRSGERLVSNPWLIPLGAGFNNRYALNEGDSPHNMYLTLITELGLIGLFLYVRWLHAVWAESGMRVALGSRVVRGQGKIFLPVEMRPLLAAMAFGLLSGELLYIYRPTFALMGMFLFICAILNHPAMLNAARDRLRTAARWRALAAFERAARLSGAGPARPLADLR